jgi:DNA-binding PadR family transcriptional regulator
MAASKNIPDLTDHEGALLAEVLRHQPVTAYRIAKLYSMDPVTSFNSSKGQVYPMIRRFSEAGLVEGSSVSGDGRGTEKWRCTKKGEAAVKRWAGQVKPSHLLLEDPLRTKVMSFDLLSHDERVQWVLDAKTQLAAKLEELEEYARQVDVPYQPFVHDNAVNSLRSRMDWLDRMLFTMVKKGMDEGEA